MKKKEEVYVKIDSSNVAKVAKLLNSVGEELVSLTDCLAGRLGGGDFMVLISLANQWARVEAGSGDLKGKAEVSLEELAEILGVKRQFKIGDRVKIKRSSMWYNTGNSNPKDIEGKIFEFIGKAGGEFNCRVKWDNNHENAYHTENDLELVSSATTQEQQEIETITISRANLGRIYPTVCTTWKATIDELINKAGNFAVDIEVPLETLRKAYSEANYEQKSLLIEVSPLPKIKSTVKVSRWVNVYEDANIHRKISNVYVTKELALDGKAHTGYITTIELTGEYTTEVEDPLMENIDELRF